MLEMLMIEGYDVEFSKTLDSKGKGRVLAYVKSDQNLKRQLNLEQSDNDILVFKRGNELIVGVYAGFQSTPILSSC